MENVEKNMLIGAFATGAVDAGLEGYWAYNVGLGQPPVDFPYTQIHPAIPPVDDWIADAGFPLLLYLLGKGVKNKALVQMAKGGAIYGAGELLGITLYRIVVVTRPAASYRVVR